MNREFQHPTFSNAAVPKMNFAVDDIATRATRTMPARVFSILTFAMASFIGCSGSAPKDESRTQVSGQITLNGKPLPAGNLTFKLKDSPLATQVGIKAEGRYVTDRVPIGRNMVSIETESLQYGSPSLYTAIPAKYTEYVTSGLEVDIKPGVNENVNFELKP